MSKVHLCCRSTRQAGETRTVAVRISRCSGLDHLLTDEMGPVCFVLFFFSLQLFVLLCHIVGIIVGT